MKSTILAVALLALCPATVLAQSSAPTASASQPQVYTFAIDLDSDGRITSLSPTGEIPATMRAALEDRITDWVFQPARRDGTAAMTTRSYLRIAVADNDLVQGAPRILSATTGPAVNILGNPEYPTSELRRGEGGVVVLQVAVKSDGTVSGVEFHGDKQRATRSMANAARDAAWNWQFTPEQVNGTPIASSVLVPVCFMADTPSPSSCSWQGPDARNLNRLAIVTLDPAVQVDTQAGQLAGF